MVARKVYTGEALRAVAMPLGGIGTGTIAICGDGSLRQWQIVNEVNHLACLPHSFFSIWTRRSRPRGEPVARVLQSAALYGTPPDDIAPTTNDHLVPLAHQTLLKRLPGVQATTFTGGYPIAELAYEDEALPVQVTMEAFNPFIPLNEKDSALPVALFSLTVHNPNEYPLGVSLAAALQNAVGWDGAVPIFDTSSFVYGGNTNSLTRLGAMTAIVMNTARLPEDDDAYGSMVLAALSDSPVTYQTQWNDLAAFWADFSSDGKLSNTADTTPSPAGRTWNGALAVPFTLQADETRTVTFMIAWHFPNHYVRQWQRWPINMLGITDEKSKFWIGHQYSNWFGSALDVADYVQSNFERLATTTRLARDTFYDTTLPYALIDSVTSQMSITRSPTCFWDENGRFFGFEGCNGASTPQNEAIGGCCPLNCTHVWNYEMALARLYPSLERSMRAVEWDIQQHPSGYLPHRVIYPLYLPRLWDVGIIGPMNPALDGLLGAILKTYREYLAYGETEWLEQVWPSVRLALDHIWTSHDPARSGIIEGEQPNTYDISIYGANTFIGTLYLAALRAVEEMAKLRGEDALASECRQVFERGQQALEARLWNGEYYIQDVDLSVHPEQNWGQGCHTDHLLGQWWAHILGLGHVLDPQRVRTATSAIARHNFRENFHGIQQAPRAFAAEDDPGLLLCSWPNGGRPEVPTLYSDEVWTGMEYEVAALLIYEGENDKAMKILEATRSRHDGRKGNPWNDVECGDHYVRAMSSWALLEAASGYHYDAGRAALRFAPRFSPEDFRAPFFTRDGWGTFSQKVGETHTASLKLCYGTLTLNSLALQAAGAQTAVGDLEDDALAMSFSSDGAMLNITFASSVTLHAGQTLTVRLSGSG